MKRSTFKRIKAGISIVLAIAVGVAVVQGYWIIPTVAVLIASVLTLMLSKHAKGVRHDERDLKIAGMAAKMTFSIYGLIAAVLGATLIALDIRTIGLTLVYTVCALLVLHVGLYKHYEAKEV